MAPRNQNLSATRLSTRTPRTAVRAALRAQPLAFNADAVAIALALALAALIRFNILPHVRW